MDSKAIRVKIPSYRIGPTGAVRKIGNTTRCVIVKLC